MKYLFSALGEHACASAARELNINSDPDGSEADSLDKTRSESSILLDLRPPQ